MNKKKIEAKIIADSINQQGDRITTYLLTYPRFIHSELMTHRVFSRNSASSRAIPFEKMVKMVEEDPFIPIAWQKSHVGMQGSEYFQSTCREEFGHLDRAFAGYQEYQNKPSILQLEEEWLESRDNAVQQAKALNYLGITKQLCNRLLEPFMWHTVLVTATEYDNFFELRLPKYKLIGLGGDPAKSRKEWLKKMQFSSALHPSQYPKTEEEWRMLSESGAEIHIQALAEAMWDARNESTPNQLEEGEWHMPFMGEFNSEKLLEISGIEPEDFELVCRKVATARCARLSYMTFDNEIDYEKDIKLHDSLLKSGHASPFEHVCRVLTNEEYESCGKIIPLENGTFEFQKGWVDNFRGYKSYRRILNI